MTVQSLSIKDLFNYLSTHFVDKFSRLTASVFTTYINRFDSTNLRQLNDDIPIKLDNLSKLILLIFEKDDFLQCGENALSFVNLLKAYPIELSNSKISWLSSDLNEFCKNSNTTIQSNPLTIDDTFSSQQTSAAPTNSNNNQLSSNQSNGNINQTVNNTNLELSTVINSLRDGINNDIQSQFKNFMLSSLPKSAKDEHYQDLASLIDKKTQLDNSLAINKSYHTNKVIQKTLGQSNFPSPWMNDDPEFVDQFNKLITMFQTQIQEFNIKFIEDKLNKINSNIENKMAFIKIVDINATEKCKALESDYVKKHKQKLTNSMEKVNRLITLANEPSITQNQISQNSSQRSNQNSQANRNEQTNTNTYSSYQRRHNKSNHNNFTNSNTYNNNHSVDNNYYRNNQTNHQTFYHQNNQSVNKPNSNQQHQRWNNNNKQNSINH